VTAKKPLAPKGELMKRPMLISVIATLAACAAMAAHGQSAVAVLDATAGNSAKGTIGFEQRGDKVFVDAKVSGLAPGTHGFHVHEKGDCSAADGMSAGGHFNPTAKPHGNPASADHHAGDMPALVADAAGNATLQAELSPMSVGGGVTDIVGKAVIVHKDADDYATQPTGNSGARVACGVIRKR
jgi:Cu-Zn family superoxide dismutase